MYKDMFYILLMHFHSFWLSLSLILATIVNNLFGLVKETPFDIIDNLYVLLILYIYPQCIVPLFSFSYCMSSSLNFIFTYTNTCNTTMCVYICIWLCTYVSQGKPASGSFLSFHRMGPGGRTWVISPCNKSLLVAEPSLPTLYILLNIIFKCPFSPRVIESL